LEDGEMRADLTGKVALVTGSSSGTGKSIALKLADCGADICVNGRDPAKGDRVVNEIAAWIAERPADEAANQMQECEVVAARVYSAADIVNDPIFHEREGIIRVDDPQLGPVRMQGVIPNLHDHAGQVWRTAPALGQDDDLVYREFLGVEAEEYDRLPEVGTI
jgi:formyl-CoA transferase